MPGQALGYYKYIVDLGRLYVMGKASTVPNQRIEFLK